MKDIFTHIILLLTFLTLCVNFFLFLSQVSMEAVDVPLMEAVEYFIYDFGNGPANR